MYQLPSLPAPLEAPYHVAPPLDQPESLRWSSTDAQGWRRKARAVNTAKGAHIWVTEAMLILATIASRFSAKEDETDEVKSVWAGCVPRMCILAFYL